MSDEKPRLWHSVLATTLLLIAGCVCLVGLFILTLGTIGLAVAIGGGLFLMVVFHYLVWGWWLGPAIEREVRAEEEEEERNAGAGPSA